MPFHGYLFDTIVTYANVENTIKLMILEVILFFDSKKKLSNIFTNPWNGHMAFVIALPAYKKKQKETRLLKVVIQN